MSPEEIRTVRSKIPYFDKHSIVLDVGSNKGEFTDILINNVSQIHLLEPNSDLLTYTRIKYDVYQNAIYSNLAAYKESDKDLTLFTFSNQHSGLSSIYQNHAWTELPGMTPRKTRTITIDDYCKNLPHVDFIKIDVEGAEFDVLQGAKKMLDTKKIKYIQIEYSPHYRLGNHSFKEVIKFVNERGYGVYSCDVEGLEWTVENFVEDYRLDNFIIKNMDITEDWNAEFKKNTRGMKFNFALEIGAFEGLTTTYICDNLLTEGGRIIAIDPLRDQYLTENLRKQDKAMNQELSTMFKGQYKRFKKNTKGKPVELIRKTSREAFEDLGAYRFDFIYIDGDHRKREVYNDGVEAFKILKRGGYILFDDYQWRPETTEGINKFLNEYASYLTVLIKDYQVMIQKTKVK